MKAEVSPVIPIRVHCFSQHKSGNSASENEDAYAVRKRPLHISDGYLWAYAIADGATEASYTREWADLLVRAFAQAPFTRETLRTRLGPLQKQWDDDVSARPLKRYALEKARQGAFATMIGLTLVQRESGHEWRAIAVGDSCLFHVRGHQLVGSTPVTDWHDFDNSPMLISSRGVTSNLPLWREGGCSEETGTWEPGDAFLLMSDALACWFLAHIAEDSCAVNSMLDLAAEPRVRRAQRRFRSLVRTLRDARHLRNDDVTLVIVQPCDPQMAPHI